MFGETMFCLSCSYVECIIDLALYWMYRRLDGARTRYHTYPLRYNNPSVGVGSCNELRYVRGLEE